MSRTIKNCYIKVPTGVKPSDLIEDARVWLAQNDQFDRLARIQYRSGDEWICAYEAGFLSLEETPECPEFKEAHVAPSGAWKCFEGEVYYNHGAPNGAGAADITLFSGM